MTSRGLTDQKNSFRVDVVLLGVSVHCAEIHFERVAVTPKQIRDMNLLTRPTKKSDSRARNFKGESVEVDAIPPKQLIELARSRIQRHIRPEEIQRLQVIENAERETLHKIATDFGW